MTGPEVWREFERDPRHPEHAPMRASDADRDIVLRTLGEAYAEGRLDRDEHDERVEWVTHAKTLGELPPVLEDLVPSAAVVPYAGVGALDARSVEEQAVARYERGRREALMGFLIPSLITWAVWAATMLGGFPWPVFVMIGTGIPVVRAVVQKKDIIESHRASIVRKQEKELRKQRREPPPSP